MSGIIPGGSRGGAAHTNSPLPNHPPAHHPPTLHSPNDYIVKPHDTIFTIAHHFGIEPKALLDANPSINRQTRALFVGQHLTIPHKTAVEDTRPPRWLEIALAEAKFGGHASGFYRAGAGMGGKDWCSIFVNWVMRQAGMPGTGSAMASSWLNWGTPIERPRPGAVAILNDGRMNVPGYENNPWYHVTIFVNGGSTSFSAVGGNQPNVCTAHYGPPRLRKAAFRWPTASMMSGGLHRT